MIVKIGILAPYRGLEHVVLDQAAQIDGIEIEVSVTREVDALRQAALLEERGVDVLVSRGLTAETIKGSVSVPLIEIEVSGFDILRTLLLVKGTKEQARVIGFPSVCSGVSEVSKLLAFSIPYTQVNTTAETERAVQAAWEAGTSLIIGDAVTMSFAEKFGLKGIMITSGKESVAQAIQQARQIGHVLLKNKQETAAYQSMMHTLSDGVILFEKTGRVRYMNPAFANMFKEQEYIQELEPPINQLLLQSIGKPFIQEKTEAQGRQIIIEGTSLDVQEQPHYLVKCIEESRYALDRDGLSVQPFRTEMISFTQLSETDPSLKKVIEYCKHEADASTFLLNGAPGTGKKSLAYAMHQHRHSYSHDIWRVTLKSSIHTQTLTQLEKLLSASKGTYYIKGWETLAAPERERLWEAASRASALIFFVSEQRPGADVPAFLKSVTLPPLKERIDHLEDYARLFISLSNVKYGKQVVGIGSRLLAYWKKQAWEHNLSELSDAIERAVANSTAVYLEKEDTVPVHRNGIKETIDLSRSLKEMELDIIMRVVKQENYNQSTAAKRLGINRSTLWRRLKEAEAE
ncbi:PAS domain-containing protein [Sinobaca qinghaiensis]|uniref:PAS domain-containing protein n=1 Tax=Sinobaca qinghaiensis TaxID=342944 RepID=A0A419UWJ1_9BACL|nr:sigma-54-dependent Fis family transcriptional regulator [Sinobaca qinghaiensis]RKD69496.1 PAS domain-containing protein [Sinobaca qinghaiensis]